jgi:tRNA-dihydrouridine synthase C
MLRSPELMYETTAALVEFAAGRVPVTVKMRTGFEDSSLFQENLIAVQAAGAAFVTVHGRTRVQGYDGRADWALIARAKEVISIPVVRVLPPVSLPD